MTASAFIHHSQHDYNQIESNKLRKYFWQVNKIYFTSSRDQLREISSVLLAHYRALKMGK
jgi:hypothetical protein